MLKCGILINNINRHGFTKSACILNFDNDLYIVTSNYSYSEVPEPIRLYNMEGYKIKEINYKINQTYFIDIYHDKKSDIKYIITGNLGFVRTYDYTNDCKYHRYNDDENEYEHYKVIIFDNSEIIKIIAAGKDGQVLIWDFHSTELLKKIKVNEFNYDNLYGICLWNNELLFVGCGNCLKAVDIENEKVVNSLFGHSNNILTIKTVIHPFYGECIISQELYSGQIKLWINKTNKMKYIIGKLYEKLKFY
jgi:WD40 repeat protein